MQFLNECNKVVIELSGVQFWSEIILVISNQTRSILKSHVGFQKNCTPFTSITIINSFST